MFLLSLPMRGAWIEIANRAIVVNMVQSRSPCGERGLKFRRDYDILRRLMSLPMRGAWIEILYRAISPIPYGSRSPCGERGLKCRRVTEKDVH